MTVPKGAQFASVPSATVGTLTFEYLGADLDINLASDQVAPSGDGKLLVYTGLPVTQSAVQPTQAIGGSTGEPNQSFAIPSSPVVLSTLVVQVNEGAGWVTWSRVDSLLYQIAGDGRVTLSSAQDRDYFVQFDENDTCWVCFGDGTYGMAASRRSAWATSRPAGISAAAGPATCRPIRSRQSRPRSRSPLP